jgi:hypothetical protein
MRWRLILMVVAVVAVVGVVLGTWNVLYRAVPQPLSTSSDADSNFLYGSIENESEASLPYWVAVVLPRIFGEQYLAGPGGYAALLPWEEGHDLPVGFAKKRVGVDRVSFNCALCHTSAHPLPGHETARIAAAGALHAADVKGLADFFTRSASDARFNADTILQEIDLAYRLGTLERLLYRYVLIPASRERLTELGARLTSPHAATVSPSGSTRPGLFPKDPPPLTAASIR